MLLPSFSQNGVVGSVQLTSAAGTATIALDGVVHTFSYPAYATYLYEFAQSAGEEQLGFLFSVVTPEMEKFQAKLLASALFSAASVSIHRISTASPTGSGSRTIEFDVSGTKANGDPFATRSFMKFMDTAVSTTSVEIFNSSSTEYRAMLRLVEFSSLTNGDFMLRDNFKSGALGQHLYPYSINVRRKGAWVSIREAALYKLDTIMKDLFLTDREKFIQEGSTAASGQRKLTSIAVENVSGHEINAQFGWSYVYSLTAHDSIYNETYETLHEVNVPYSSVERRLAPTLEDTPPDTVTGPPAVAPPTTENPPDPDDPYEGSVGNEWDTFPEEGVIESDNSFWQEWFSQGATKLKGLPTSYKVAGGIFLFLLLT